MTALLIARMVCTALVLGLSLLAVFRAPIGALWMPAIVATEAGYLVVLLTIPSFAGGVSTRADLAMTLLGALSVVLLLSPLVRARAVAAETPHAMQDAFASLTATPPPSEPALAASRLLAFTDPDVAMRTLSYATDSGEALAIDLYGAAGDAPRPFVILIHGGSWSGGDRTQLPSIARRLAADGWAVASIDYRLAPQHPFPAAFDDVRAATEFLRAQSDSLGLDRDRVVLYGRSAGAHLALLAAYRWHAPFVRGVVALYPPTDLVWSWEHPTNPLVLDTPGTLRAFLGGAPTDSETMRARYHDASPLAWADAESPPTLLVHGGRDELVSPRQTDRLDARLSELGVPHLALRLPWATHGCEASFATPSGQLVESSVRYFLGVVAPVR